MMLLDLPRRTPKVPMIEVMMQTPQMASGSSIILFTLTGSLRKKIAASTMVATVVTA